MQFFMEDLIDEKLFANDGSYAGGGITNKRCNCERVLFIYLRS